VNTALFNSIYYPEIFKYLISVGANIEHKNTQGRTPIFYSHGIATDLLIEQKANIEHRDNYGNTPLFSNTLFEPEDRIKTLLKYGADVSAVNNKGMGVLDFSPSTIKERLESGIPAKITNYHLKPSETRKQTLNLLYDHGADISHLEKKQLTEHIKVVEERKRLQLNTFLIDNTVYTKT
jgi:ankyrin repeat protein